MGRALQSGAVTLPGSPATQAVSRVAPTGEFAPSATVLPNVKASTGSQPVNENPITANPVNNNQLMSGGNDYNCSTIQGFYNSDNGGSTWRQHCLPSVNGGSGCGDPAVAYDRNNNAYIMGIRDCSVGDMVIQSSTNNGVTWGTAHLAFGSLFTNGFTDKEWMEADTNAASPFVNCLYVSWTDFNSNFTQTRASVAHSCDGGNTWTRVAVDSTQTVPKIDQFTDLAIGPDGTVYLTWLQCQVSGPAGDCGNTSVQMKFSKSTNGGNTWTAPSIMGTAQTAPDSCFCAYYGNLPGTQERLSNIPAIDIDKSDGSLHVAYYTYTGGQTRVGEIHSTNGGTSWSAFKQIAAQSANMGWQWLAVSPNGTVGISLMVSLTTGTYITGAAISTNGGVSFPSKFKTSSAQSRFSNDGFGGGFIGDYSGGIWTGGTLHTSWPDARTAPAADMTGGVIFP